MRSVLVLCLLPIALVACADDDNVTVADETATTIDASEETDLPTAPCDAAFSEAAAVGDMEDSVSDLYPAAKACESLEDWIAAHENNPGAIDEDVDPATFATNVCLYGPEEEPELRTAPLCEELAAG